MCWQVCIALCVCTNTCVIVAPCHYLILLVCQGPALCWRCICNPSLPSQLLSPLLFYCAAVSTCKSNSHQNYPPLQLSYSADGIFISIGAFADRPDGTGSYQSGLHVFPKHVVFSTPSVDLPSGSPSIVVNRATYLPDRSWFRSLPLKVRQAESCVSQTVLIQSGECCLFEVLGWVSKNTAV